MKITSAVVTILASIMAVAPSAAAASADARRRPVEDVPNREKLRRNAVGMSVSLSFDYKADDGSKSVSMSYATIDGLESELHQGSKSRKSKSSKAGQSCTDLAVTTHTDDWAVETSWNLVDLCTGQEVLGVPSGYYTLDFTTTTLAYCIPPSQYQFTIRDR